MVPKVVQSSQALAAKILLANNLHLIKKGAFQKSANFSRPTNHAQVIEPIGSLCMIVGLAPRVILYEWRRQNLFLSIKITSIPQNSLISFLPEAYSANKSTSCVSSSKLPPNQSFKVRSPLRIWTAKNCLLREPSCDMQASERYLHTNEFVALHRPVDKTFQTHQKTIKGEIFCSREHWTTHVVSWTKQ